MNTQQMMPFQFQEHPVRVVMHADAPWWIAKDVCEVLTIANHKDAIGRLDDDEKDEVGITDAIGRIQNTLAVNESGLYHLIFQSRKPEAKAFRKWVTSEVLPQIRRTGNYALVGASVLDADVDLPGVKLHDGTYLTSNYVYMRLPVAELLDIKTDEHRMQNKMIKLQEKQIALLEAENKRLWQIARNEA